MYLTRSQSVSAAVEIRNVHMLLAIVLLFYLFIISKCVNNIVGARHL